MSKQITQIELARLAATMNGDTRKAYELWEASGKELDYQKARGTLRAQGARERDSIPVPVFAKWNELGGTQKELKPAMTLQEFLRLVRPKLDVPTRTKRYRDYLLTRCTDPEEKGQREYIQREMEQAKADGFNVTTYEQEARAFLRWEAERARNAKSARGQAGGKAKAKGSNSARGIDTPFSPLKPSASTPGHPAKHRIAPR